MTDMDLSEVRRRTTVAVLRSAIAARGACPAAERRCSCHGDRGLMHCPTPGHADSSARVPVPTGTC